EACRGCSSRRPRGSRLAAAARDRAGRRTSARPATAARLRTAPPRTRPRARRCRRNRRRRSSWQSGRSSYMLVWGRGNEKGPRGAGLEMAEREGFEPPCRLPGKTLSRRPRYDHFGTSPLFGARSLRLLADVRSITLALRRSLRSAHGRALGAISFLRATIAEEGLQQVPRFVLEHAAGDFEPVVERRMRVGLHRRLDRTGFRLRRAVNQPRDARVDHCPDAHLARLDRDIQRRAGQPVIPEPP